MERGSSGKCDGRKWKCSIKDCGSRVKFCNLKRHNVTHSSVFVCCRAQVIITRYTYETHDPHFVEKSIACLSFVYRGRRRTLGNMLVPVFVSSPSPHQPIDTFTSCLKLSGRAKP